MIIGVPKEIKNNENRVALTPGGVKTLVSQGHTVYVEKNAGLGSSFENADYEVAGATLIEDKQHLFDISELIIKVKEPLESEYELFHEGQNLFTYLHLAANLKLTEALIRKKITSIAYETVELPNGRLPLLMPMSEVAGRMSVQIGATLLQKYNGGAGILLGGVPGVKPAKVLIIGGGVVGTNAAKMAIGLGAIVTIMDVNSERMAYLDDIFGGRVTTLKYNYHNVEDAVVDTDLLIGAVLVTGEKAPKTVTTEMVKSMKKGAVIVDVAIDQGGSIETIDRVTTHDNPSYEKYGVIHYSVANMPGAVPRTSTFALEAATLPYILELANLGVIDALKFNSNLAKGLNTFNGYMTCKGVADSFNLVYTPVNSLLN
ncbi:MAG: alanine dehydrogenase [Firmicutes bacterium HGW-Firmicutes-1]|jgi:alanine dehydrogenase|nr:MAG: alanine dehydrogenase [Firmicutes bacterium HGW-Firmicutes-1]